MVAKRSAGSPPLYNRLATLRAERGLSRAELAERVGIHAQSVGFIERGDYGPSLELALRIAQVFDLPVEAIFSLEPLPPLSQSLYNQEKP
ncbi:helix-turn-helix transcriptional regulator [Deinococcus lacus]|uniref:Helix-turn-helix transcriptional regulator n=1 Tax=Deinococcus lacus TaxID=392561 RepID=A0ABW1Y8X5_9DEIO